MRFITTRQEQEEISQSLSRLAKSSEEEDEVMRSVDRKRETHSIDNKDRQTRQTDREGIEIIEALLLFCQRMLS